METSTTSTISGYQVIRRLGHGGFGEVLLAEDADRKRYAIKRPLPGATATDLKRYTFEARAGDLNHVNIAKVYPLQTQADGLPLLPMEFVDGVTLKTLIGSGKPIELIQKLSIVKQLCLGLGHAHQMNIVHRDIKPENIMIEGDLEADVIKGPLKVKIIDFGIAKALDVEESADVNLTQAGMLVGSLHYIAPERFSPTEIPDGRADIFSAGVVLYLLLTGTLPFLGRGDSAVYRIQNEEQKGLGAYLKDYPPTLDEILVRSLAKSPEDRYTTAEDFADALQDVIGQLIESKISQIVSDAENLMVKGQHDAALKVLADATILDGSNTQVRKLAKLIRDQKFSLGREARVRECIARALPLIDTEDYDGALGHLRQALGIDPNSIEVRDRIAAVEAKKERSERAAAALRDVKAAQNRGDLETALRVAEIAVQADPNNTSLLAARSAIAKQLESAKLQGRLNAVLDAAQKQFAARDFPAVEKLLRDAETIDSSHPLIESLRKQIVAVRKSEERRQVLEEIHQHVNTFLRTDNYEQATGLLNRAIETLPDEPTLLRLKREVDTASRQYDSKRFVDRSIGEAQDLFQRDPSKALAILQRAIDQMPGEERLIASELSLRQQWNAIQSQRQLGDLMRSASDFIASQQPDKAIGVIETYQLEHGSNSDVDDLLKVARRELADRQRKTLISTTVVDVRALVKDGKLDDAIQLLEPVTRNPILTSSGDRTLITLLDEVRRQRADLAHKIEISLQRAETLRQRGELSEAIRILKESSSGSGSRQPAVQALLDTVQAELERKQATARALEGARAATQKKDFTGAFASLQSIARVYGESDELKAANKSISQARSDYAQEVVGQSISASRASLLNNDIPGALAALRAANQMVEFADEAKQTDWKKIGQAAKRAQAEPLPAGAAIPDPLADLPDLPPVRKPLPVPLIAGGGGVLVVALAVVGVLLMKKPAPVQPASAVVQSFIDIIKAPPGASVMIDQGQPSEQTATADPTGAAHIPVTPGDHKVAVTMDGYEPFNDPVPVDPGRSVREPVLLTKLPPASKSGTLVVQGNLAEFKVFVDGASKGLKRRGDKLTLEQGDHQIHYTNSDGSAVSPDRKITITAGAATPDNFSLAEAAPKPPPVTPAKPTIAVAPATVPVAPKTEAPAAPTTGSLTITTTPGAHLSLDGQDKGTVDGTGTFSASNLSAVQHSYSITLNGYITISEQVTIKAGAEKDLDRKLTPQPKPADPPKPVAVAPPAAPVAPAAADHTADYAGIAQALANFKAAYESRDIGRVKSTWLDIGSRASDLQGVITDKSTNNMLHISEVCQVNPTFTSENEATQHCTEIAQFTRDFTAKLPKQITFVKKGGVWVMKDKK